MRAFVTGGHGFVGGWLRAHLAEAGDDVVAPGEGFDVTEGDAVAAVVKDAAPDAVYHLAALTHVGDSWADPGETFRVNVLGTVAVLEAARACDPPPRVLLVSSAEVYGAVQPDELPLREDSPLRPASPYAASKVAAEFAGVQAFLGHGLPVVRVRAFNHVGPGQAGRFVIASVARQVVEAERAGGGTVHVGNLSPRRDFTDVRDVVRAYRLLAEGGEPGEVYQVCSGRDVAVSTVVERLVALATVPVTVEVDERLVRAVDVPVLVGDAGRLRAATGWEPRHDLDATLGDVLEWWRAH